MLNHVKGSHMQKNFDSQRSGTGTKEWADTNFNITEGCRNNCLYCYAAQMAARFKRRERDLWQEEVLTPNAFITKTPKRTGVVMFPSTHDITPANVHDYSRMAELMLAAGNHLLITSKPRLDIIKLLVRELEPWKEQILFRFTIGTMNTEVAAFWEPGAPTPLERLEALQAAFDAGFRTSISIEPMLGGVDEAIHVVHKVSPCITDTIWIGKMNGGKSRVPAEYHYAVDKIEYQQRDEEILRLVKVLCDQPEIRWKDSIQKVIRKYAGITAKMVTR